MSEEFDFLDELITEITVNRNESQFSVDESHNYVESFKKSNCKSELEEKLRKDNARLRSRLKSYSKSLNDQGERLTQLLTEKLSMREEQERIQDCKKKVEEANVYIEATEQLNKQLHELAKTYETDKKGLSEKIQTLQKKVRKLKKEINGMAQQKLREKKRRLKQLRILIEFSEILITLGLLPVKYKRSHDSWKFEVSCNEDLDKDGDHDVEEKAKEEKECADTSLPSPMAEVQSSLKEPSKVATSGWKEENPLDVISESESSDDEGCRGNFPPSKNPPHVIPNVDSVKALCKRLINSTNDMLRDGSDFGSNVTSPYSSSSGGYQHGTGSSCVGSEGSSGSRVVSPQFPSEIKSLPSEVGRTGKSLIMSLGDEDWHWDGDESCEGLPTDRGLEGEKIIEEIRPMVDDGKQGVKKNQGAKEKSNGSSDLLDVHDILVEMIPKPPALLMPFEEEAFFPHPHESLCSEEKLSQKLTEKLVIGVAEPNSVTEAANHGVGAVVDHSSLPIPKNMQLEKRLLEKGSENTKGTSAVSDQVDLLVTADVTEGKSSTDVSPPRLPSGCEMKNDNGVTRNLVMDAQKDVFDSTLNSESCSYIKQSQKGDISKLNEVFSDLPAAVAIESVTSSENVSGSSQSASSIMEKEERCNNISEKLVKCIRATPKKIASEEESNEDKQTGKGKPKKIMLEKEEEPEGKKNSRGGKQKNVIKPKSPVDKNMNSLKEECQRRFSLRLRKNMPEAKVICPATVNNGAKVPSEVDSECSLDNNSTKGIKHTDTKKGKRGPRSTRQIVDYSDTSDTSDSVASPNLNLERSIPSEVIEECARELTVDNSGPSESNQMPEEGKNDSGVQTRSKKLRNKYSPKGDVPFIMEERGNTPPFEEQSSPMQACNDHENQNFRVEGSIRSKNSGQFVTYDDTTSAGGGLSFVENSPSPLGSLESPSAEDCGISVSESTSNSSNNDSGSVRSFEEMSGNSCHSEEDQESEKSEIESNITIVSVVDQREELPHFGAMPSRSLSLLSLSSDDSSVEYSDALSVVDKCESDTEIPNTSEFDDASKKDSCESRKDTEQNVSTVPILSDGIPSSVNLSGMIESPILATDHISSFTSNQKESDRPIQKSAESHKLPGTEHPEESINYEIHDKRLSHEDHHANNQVKNVFSDHEDKRIIDTVSSKGINRFESIDQMVKPSIEKSSVPDVNSNSNTPATQELHTPLSAHDSLLIRQMAKRKSMKRPLLLRDSYKNVFQAENVRDKKSNKESVEKHFEDLEKFSEKIINRDGGYVKSDWARVEEPPEKCSPYSFGIVKLLKLFTSPQEKSKNLVAHIHEKTTSVLNGITPRRHSVPFLFGKNNLFRFPGVKFRIGGHFASEFYPEPYLVPKYPVLSFGQDDFQELYQTQRAKIASEKSVNSGVKFYKRGPFAPPHFPNLYLNPKRLSINMGHQSQILSCFKAENNSPYTSDSIHPTSCSEVAASKDVLGATGAPCDNSVKKAEVLSKESLFTLCNGQEISSEHSCVISDKVNMPVTSDAVMNDFMTMVHDSQTAPVGDSEAISEKSQIFHEKQFSGLTSRRADSSERQNVFCAESDSFDEHLRRLPENQSNENSLISRHESNQMLPGHIQTLTSSGFNMETTSCAIMEALGGDSKCHGENTSSKAPKGATEMSQKERIEHHGNGATMNSQLVEGIDGTESAETVSHDSCDSFGSGTSTRESYSSEGYSNDKEDSPSRSVVDSNEKNCNSLVEGNSLKECSSIIATPNASVEVDPHKPKNSILAYCPSKSKKIAPRDVDLQDENYRGILASSDENLSSFDESRVNLKDLSMSGTCTRIISTSMSYIEVDPKKPNNSSQANCASNLEEVTPRGMGHQDESHKYTSLSSNQGNGFVESRVNLKDVVESDTCSNSVISVAYSEGDVEGETGKNKNCGLTSVLDIVKPVITNEDNGGKFVEGKNVERIDDGNLIGDVGIDDIIMAICPGGPIPDVSFKSDGSSESAIFGTDGGNLLHIELPLEISAFPAKQGDEKGNIMDLFDHENENNIRQINEKRTLEEEKESSLVASQVGAGISQNSYSEESAYSSISGPTISGSGTNSSTSEAANKTPELALKERAAEALHIDKCLMAENLDALIELAGGLHSFDDGCMGSDAIEIRESIAETNILSKSPTMPERNNDNANNVNEVGMFDDNCKYSFHNSELVEGTTSLPSEMKEIKPFSTGSEGGGIYDQLQKSKIQSRLTSEELVSHSSCVSGSFQLTTDKSHLHSAGCDSIQSCAKSVICHLSEKNTDNLPELAVGMKYSKDKSVGRALCSDRELKTLEMNVNETNELPVTDYIGQPDGVHVINGEILEKHDDTFKCIESTSPLKISCSEVKCTEKVINSVEVDTETNAQREVGTGDFKVTASSEISVTMEVNTLLLSTKPISKENEIVCSLSESPDSVQSSKSKKLSDRNMTLEEPTSPDGSASPKKCSVIKKVFEKDLFGTDFSDASSDSEPVVDPMPIPKRRKNRKTRIVYSSDSEDECKKRKKGNEEGPPAAKRPKIQRGRRKSFRSKCPVSINDTIDSSFSSIDNNCQSPIRNVDLQKSHSCGDEEICKNTDEVGEPADEPQELRSDSCRRRSSISSNASFKQKQLVIADARISNQVKSEDNNVPMPSVNVRYNKSSYLPIPSAPGAFSDTAVLLPHKYESRKSQTPIQQILVQVQPVKEKEINLPNKSCDAKHFAVDDVLNAVAIPSSPEEEKIILKVGEKESIILPEMSPNVVESKTQIPPAIFSTRRKSRKQSFVSVVRCDSGTLIGEDSMEESMFPQEENQKALTQLNATSAPGVTKLAPKVKRKKAAKINRTPSLTDSLNEKDNGKEAIICEGEEHSQSSEKYISNNPQVTPTVAKCDTSSANNRSPDLCSKEKHSEDENRTSEEQGHLQPLRPFSKLLPNVNKIHPIPNSSSNKGDEGEAHSLEEGRHIKPKKRVAQVSEASPTSTEITTSLANKCLFNGNSRGKSDKEETIICKEEDYKLPYKKQKRLSKVSRAVTKSNDSLINENVSKPHSKAERKEGVASDSKEQVISLPLKKRIAHFPKVPTNVAKLDTTLLNSCSPSKAMISEGKGYEEEIAMHEEGEYKPPFKKRIAHAPKLTPQECNGSSSDMSLKENENKTIGGHDQEYNPTSKKRTAHIPRVMASTKSNCSSSKSKNSLDVNSEGNNIKKKTLVQEEPYYTPPTKKRIAHIPKSLPETTSADNFDPGSPEIDSPPDASTNLYFTRSSVSDKNQKKNIACPKAKMSKLSKLRNLVSRVKGYRPCVAGYLPSSKSHTHQGGDCCRQKDSQCRAKDESQKNCKSNTEKSRKSPRRKTKECRPSPKKRNSRSENLEESPQPGLLEEPPQPGLLEEPPQPGPSEEPPQPGLLEEPPQPGPLEEPPQPGLLEEPPQPDHLEEPRQPGHLEEDHMPKEDGAMRSLHAVNVGVGASKCPQKEPLNGNGSQSLKNPLEKSMELTSLKQELNPSSDKNDASTIGAFQKKLLEEMEVPPLSPLSEDDLVDSLIIFPDSSESPGEDDVDQTPTDNATRELTPKSHFEKGITMEHPLNIDIEVPITKGIEIKLGVEEPMAVEKKNDIKLSLVLIDNMGNGGSKNEHFQELPKQNPELPQRLGVSIDSKDSKKVGLEINPIDSGIITQSKTYTVSEFIQSLPVDSANDLTPSGNDIAPSSGNDIMLSSGNDITPSHLILKLESLSSDWRKNKDYFNKMLKQIQEENAKKENEDNVSSALPGDIKRNLKTQLKKLNGKYFGKTILDGMVAFISNKDHGFKSKNVAKYLVRMLSKEDEDDVQPAVIPGAPRMTPLQLRVLSLTMALENRCPSFNDIIEVMLAGISFTLFRLGHCPDVEVVKTLTRMYTAFCMAKKDLLRVRCFCYDALFAIGTKAVELITVVLSMWHEVLPVQESSRVPSYIETSVFMAIAHMSATKQAPKEFQKRIGFLKNIVRNMFKSEHQKMTVDQFLDKLLLNLTDGESLKDVQPAVVLLAKRQGWEWTHKNLLCGRLVSIMEDWKRDGPARSSAVTAINLIGLTSRSCPMETCGPVKNIIEVLSRTLIREPCDDPRIKEALVVNLIRLSKFHFYHIVRALDVWRPMCEPSQEVKDAIRGLVLRQALQKFWKEKYRSWKKPVINRHQRGVYFERSEPLDESEVQTGENDEDYFEWIKEEKVAGEEGENGKRWLPKRNRLAFKEWVKERKNVEWVEDEVKKWDGMAFKQSRKKKRKRKNLKNAAA